MADEPVFIFLATYDTEADAHLDYSAGVIGTYDAAVITTDANGKAKVHKHEKPTQHGAWAGVAVGAVLGILFPPGPLIDVAVAGLAGGVIGRVWNGMSRKDVKELGELLDDSSAAPLIVGKSKLDKEIKKAEKEAPAERQSRRSE